MPAGTQEPKIVASSPSATVSTIAGTGTNGYVDNTNPLLAQFNSPRDIVVDTAGNLYVADEANNRIRKIDGITGEVTTIAGDGTIGTADGPGASAQIYSPLRIAIDSAGNLYVAANYKIRKITFGP